MGAYGRLPESNRCSVVSRVRDTAIAMTYSNTSAGSAKDNLEDFRLGRSTLTAKPARSRRRRLAQYFGTARRPPSGAINSINNLNPRARQQRGVCSPSTAA